MNTRVIGLGHLSLILLSAAVSVIAPARADTYLPELVSGSSLTVDRFVDVDLAADGTPYVAYSGNSQIHLAWKSGETWQSASRLVGGGNLYCAMDLDEIGAAHFAMQAQSGTDYILMYLVYENGFWSTATPDLPNLAAGDTVTGDWPDIALDDQGQPYISYAVRYGGPVPQEDLRLAYKSGSSWVVETIDGGPENVGAYSSIAFGPQGRPRIAYYDRSNGDLKVARLNAAETWVLETVDTGVDVGAWTDIALDADGNPHLSYVDLINDTVRYAIRTAGVWTSEAVPDGIPPAAEGTSIAVDGQGDVHIVYFNTGAGRLRHAVKSGGVWSAEVIDDGGDRGWRPALALAGDDTPHVAYVAEPSQEVWYATVAAAAPVAEQIPQAAGLLRVFPNPASAGTPVRIEFAQKEGGAEALTGPVEIAIYDLAGRRVRSLPSAVAGGDGVTWDGRTDAGRPAGGGMYLVRHARGHQVLTHRLLLLP